MDSFTFHDIRVEKANATSRHRRTHTITTLFRLVELFVFAIVVSRVSSQFALSLKASGEFFRRIAVTLISPRFVFLLGNAIVIALFAKSGRFSAKNGGSKSADNFYEEYVEKCRSYNNSQRFSCVKLEEEKSSGEERGIIRSRSENVERKRRHGDEHRGDLRRSVTEVRRESPDCRRSLVAEDEMSSEEFRRTVEAFIARQQRFLREE